MSYSDHNFNEFHIFRDSNETSYLNPLLFFYGHDDILILRHTSVIVIAGMNILFLKF